MIHQITSQWRPQGRSDDNPHSINSLCHAPLWQWIAFRNYRLCGYQKGTSPQTLNKTEGYQFPQVSGIATKEGSHGKKDNGGRKIVPTPKLFGKPARHRNYDNIGYCVGRNYPCNIRQGSTKASFHVIKGHVHNGRIYDFKKGAHHRSYGYDDPSKAIFYQIVFVLHVLWVAGCCTLLTINN